MLGMKRPRGEEEVEDDATKNEGGNRPAAEPQKKRLAATVPLTPLPVHETKWNPAEAKITLNATLDKTTLGNGDTRCCNLIVVDNLFGEAERNELYNCLAESSSSSSNQKPEPPFGKTKPPPPSKWEKNTADGKDKPITYGPTGDVLKQLCSGELSAVREIWSRLTLLYPQYKICLQPGDEQFVAPSQPPSEHVCLPVVGNAPMPGDQYRYHRDGDPASFPPSNWTRQFGSYVNHEPGKPLFVSLLIYLCRYWRRDCLAETLFLDDGTETGIFVRPKGYRAVLMDQDLMHRIAAPSDLATEPRYSIVWKLVFVPKSSSATCTLVRKEWGLPMPFGSTSRVQTPSEVDRNNSDYADGRPGTATSLNSNDRAIANELLALPQAQSASSQTAATPKRSPASHASSSSNTLASGSFAIDPQVKIRGVPQHLRTIEPPDMHAFQTKTQIFAVDAKYKPLNEIGHGAYGVVCGALDTKTNTKVAIKKVPKVFDDLIDAKRVLREIKLLRHFHHENVIGLYDLVAPPSFENFTDIYIVLNFMETDLHKIIHSKNELSDDHIQYFVYQILRGLKYIHSARVIHRDLKPSNILLNGNCDLKICDFGLARGVMDAEYLNLTEYVVTRWYRAPEVMCSCREYDHKIDIWSVGCIMAELHGRKPLFPGKDYIQQMNLIFELTGSPSPADTKFITNSKALQYINSLERQPPVPFSTLYPNANPAALDLMERMLVFNPRRRFGVEEALDHPYFNNLRDKDSEIKCDKEFDFEFERSELTEESVKAAMSDEISLFRPYFPKGNAQKEKKSQSCES